MVRRVGPLVPLATLEGLDVRPVPFAIGHFVTAGGRVLSTERGSSHPRERCGTPDHGGYLMLQVSSIGRNVAVHAMIAAAFLPPRPSPVHQVRHLDGDCTNNRADNLTWGTAQDNIDDRAHHGTTACGDRNGSRTRPEARRRGECNGNAVLSAAQVAEIRRRLDAGELRADLAREHRVSWSAIDRLSKGLSWRGATHEALGAEGN